MPIGPALPPHLAHLAGSSSRSPSPPRSTTPPANPPDHPKSEDEDDAFGPSLPPHLAAARKAKHSNGYSVRSHEGPVAGPSRPTLDSPSPPRLPGRSAGNVGAARTAPGPMVPGMGYDEESDDDDVIGPTLPTGEVKEKSAIEEFMEREARMNNTQAQSSGPSRPQREEWMLLPPTSGILSAVDPLRKRPTTFSRNAQEVEIDSTVWTETPAEKAQRLADEVAGIKRTKAKRPGQGDGMDEHERARKRMRDEEIRQSVARHNKEQRGESMLEQHAKKDKKKEEPAAIWDHARDMGITGRLLNDQERSQKINEAKGLNDRFGHSKKGAYDM